MWRVEDKYILSRQEFLLLQARIAAILKPDNNQCDDHGYRVTSVYFDDYADTDYSDTVNGSARRQKYRIRIYNGSIETIKLEVKYKEYCRVLKKSQAISEQEMRLLLSGRTIEGRAYDREEPATLFNLAIAHKGLRPKVIVEYDRKAYVYQNGNVRITFDRNIRASNQVELFGTNHISYYCLEEPDYILEVKYDEYLPSFIAQLLETGNMVQVSFSKYILSRERSKNVH